jgi:hypothetical protein
VDPIFWFTGRTKRNHQPPPIGKTVDETHVITLLPDLPAPSVSVLLHDGRVFLPERRLEKMAKEAALIRKLWKLDRRLVIEALRLRMIRGERARDLLKAIADQADASGYLADQSKLPDEASYIISNLLEEGAAAVVDLETGHLIPTIKVNYFGVRAGPLIGRGVMAFFYETNSARGYLFQMEWWVS